MKKKNVSHKGQKSLISLAGIILSILFIWIFIFSIWYSRNINDRATFVNKTTQILQTENVRNAISNEIIDIVKSKKPLLGTISAPVLSNIITGVLDTDLFTAIYKRMAGELHLQLTTKNPRTLLIDVAQTKEFIAPLISGKDATLLEEFPDQIVIIKKNQIPSLYLFGTYLGILGPALLIVGLIILGLTWFKTNNRRGFFLRLFLTISAYGILIYFLIPAIGNYLISNFQSINLSIIVNEVYESFTDQLVELSLASFVLGIVGVGASIVKKENIKFSRRKRK